jgi:hypothetical protein
MYPNSIRSLPREYQVFISHAWDYKGDYDGVVGLLNTDLSFRWKNLSVEESDPLPTMFHLPRSNRSLVRQLDERISKAECLLVIDAMYVSHRDWIQSEIEAAQEFRKPIVAIAPRGQERFPLALAYAADERVGWNSASIVGAVRRLVTPRLPIPGIDPPPIRTFGTLTQLATLASPPPIQGGISGLLGRPRSEQTPTPPWMGSLLRGKK